MRKNKEIRKIYDRQTIRKILRNQLKTNKIQNAFHDKAWLKVFMKKI